MLGSCQPHTILNLLIRFSVAVITSVSLLFASLVGLTISNLHARQVEIHKTLILEVHYLRILQHYLPRLPAAMNTLVQQCLSQHTALLLSRPYANRTPGDPHTYIASSLLPLIQLPRRNNNSNEPIASLTDSILQQRSQRWLALYATPFPSVHYATLAVLATAIVLSFLVATTLTNHDNSRPPLRLLLALMWTSLAALGGVIHDLARPFAEVYQVALAL